MSARAVLLAAVTVAVLASCSEESPAGSNWSVELADVRAAPVQTTCSGIGFNPSYHIVFDAQVVNTTDTPVSVTGASAWGAIIEARDSTVLGHTAHVFASLPFTVAIARPRDGDARTRITMHALCSALPPRAAPLVVLTTLFVTTSSGQFSSQPIRITVR